MTEKIKKIGVGGILAVFCFISLFGSLLVAKPAYAGAMMVANPGFDVFITNGIKKQIKEPIAEKIKVGVMMAVMRLLTYFVQKVSYDLAVYAASGGKGQGALAQAKNFSSYMKNVSDHAVGGAIDELGKAMGLNLCKPPDLSLELTLRLGLKQRYCDPETGKGGDQGICTPTCTLSQFTKNWSAVGGSKYWQRQADNFNFALKPSQSDFGYYLESSAKVDNINAKATAGSENQRKEDQGAKGVTSLISGDIKTPGAVMMEQYKKQSPANQAEKAQDNTTAALASGAEQIPQFAASVFLNTFLSTALKNFMDKGMLFGKCVIPSKCDNGDVGVNETVANYDSYGLPGRAAAAAYYSYMLQINYDTINDFDLLTQFETCDTDNRGLHNCVLDSAFAEAVRRADLGEAVTIEQLIKENPSFGERKFYNPADEKNLDYKCYQSGFCYYNIKKLRQARILPLGFEIAATLSPTGNPITLNDVLAGFNDDNSPYYHLVDPDWLLKMPKARCDLYAYGSSLSGADSNSRAQECEDLKSCVATNSKGECTAYGYCVREGNIWNFDLTACTPQYRTCKAFTEKTSGEKSAYLYRSLDAQNCTADNSGCQAYTFTSNVNTSTVAGFAGRVYDYSWRVNEGFVKYFKTSAVESCTADAVGCSAFIPSNNTSIVYLKKAPGYLLSSRSFDTDSGADCGVSGINGLTKPIWCWVQSLSNFFSNTKPLDCYRKSNGDYPSTKAELSAFEQELKNIGAYDECNKYAKICLPEEENCNMYSPTSYSGLDVPAKFSPAVVDVSNQVAWNDQCDKSCVGYAAYQELDSNYANGHDIEYIIPSTGSSCTNVGCSSFTNMGTTAGNVENVEYFSYLRPCILPDTQKQKQFVTYEGSESSGYRLATYQLVEEKITGSYTSDNKTGTGGETGPLGSPKYFYRTSQDLVKYNNVCNEKVYWGGASGDYTGTSYYWDKELSPDCRQFNDNEGRIYYRLLSKTIVSSDKCTSYRLNSTELYNDNRIAEANCSGSVGKWDSTNSVCQVCFQNGEYRDGFCYYDGLPASATNNAGSSASCTKAEDTCRSFRGNTGNNIEEIFFDKIDAGSILDWQPSSKISIVNDSVQTNGYSLQFNNDKGVALSKAVILETGETYELSFWSRGTVGAADVDLIVNGQTIKVAAVGIGDTWQQYKTNAFSVPNSTTGETVTTTATISIFPRNKGLMFLDNIRLVKIRDVVNLVKNSLSVPSVCDSNLYDGLPGEALGCSSYNYNSIGSTYPIYLTNFSYLCREEAVGCTKFTDTNNLSADKPTAFNIWLESVVSSTSANITLDSDIYSCYVPNGESGCYVDSKNNQSTNRISGYTKDKIHDPDSKNNVKKVMFKPDSIYFSGYESDPIYLVANSNAVCAAANVGCVESTAVSENPNPGKPTFTTSYLKLNNPENYSDTICKVQENGCKTYTDADGGSYYFKDPKVLGQKTCSYKNDVNYTSDGVTNKVTGWFWDNVGKCASGAAVTDFSLLKTSEMYCLSNDDCSSGYQCVNMGNWPCYNESASFSTEDGGYFGLWSYGSYGFEGFAGSCPTEQHGCTKFVDHNDVQTVRVSGKVETMPKAYYYLTDDKYSARVSDSSCGGEVSIKKGCILLDKTDDPTKKYNTAASYNSSLSNQTDAVGLVPPVSNSKNDANIIIKAVQDRGCSEWLYCGGYTLDEKGNRFCTSLRACNKADASGDDCASDGDITGSQEVTGRRMVNYSASDYVSSFGGTIDSFQKTDKPIGAMANMYNYRYRDISWAGHEFSGYSLYNYNESTLAPANGTNLRQYQIIDVANRLNSDQSPSTTKTTASITACRIYPSAESPFFRDDIVSSNDRVSKASPYGNANVFQEPLDTSKDDYLSSDCDYKKVTYGNGSVSRYYRIGSTAASGVCYGYNTLDVNDADNNCEEVKNCCAQANLSSDITTGTCKTAIDNGLQCLLKDAKITEANGQKGYCLERDYRFINNSKNGRNTQACITWLPVNNVKNQESSNSSLGLLKESSPNPDSAADDRYMCLYNKPLVKGVVHTNQKGGFDNLSNTDQYLVEGDQFAMPDFKIAVRYNGGPSASFNTADVPGVNWAQFPPNYKSSSNDGNPLTFFKVKAAVNADGYYQDTFLGGDKTPFALFTPEDPATVGGDNMILQPVQRCPLGWVYKYNDDDLSYNKPGSCYRLNGEMRNYINEKGDDYIKANQIARVDYGSNSDLYMLATDGKNDQTTAFTPYRYSSRRIYDHYTDAANHIYNNFSQLQISDPIIYESDIKRIDVYYSFSRQVSPGVVFFDVPAFNNEEAFEKLYRSDDLRANYGGNTNNMLQHTNYGSNMIDYPYVFGKSDEGNVGINNYSWLGFVMDVNYESLPLDVGTNNYFGRIFDSGINGAIRRCGDSLSTFGDLSACPCATVNADDPANTSCRTTRENTAANGLKSGFGVRAWFNEKKQFIGFEYGLGDDWKNNNDLALFVVIHVNNGRCAQVAKVWDKNSNGKPFYYNLEAGKLPEDRFWGYPLSIENFAGISSGPRLPNLNYPFYGMVKPAIVKEDQYGNLKVNDSETGATILTVDPFNFGQVVSKDIEGSSVVDVNFNSINNISYRNYYNKQTTSTYDPVYNAGIPLSIYHGTNEVYLHDKESSAGAKSFNGDLLGKMFAYVYKIYSISDNDQSVYNLVEDSENKAYTPVLNQSHIGPMIGAPICLTGTSAGACTGPVANTMVTNTFSLRTYGGIMGSTNTYPGKTVVMGGDAEAREEYPNDLGDVLLDKNGGKVSLYYYLWTDKQHLPIRKVTIDPDNSPSNQFTELSGKFPFHVPYCKAESRSGNSFYGFISATNETEKFVIPNDGVTNQDPCVDSSEPPSLTDRYYCDFYSDMFKPGTQYLDGNIKFSDIDSKYYYKGAGTSSTYHFVGVNIVNNTGSLRYDISSNIIQIRQWEAVKLGLEEGDAVCVFMPRIQAIDNWNWCTKLGKTITSNRKVACNNGSTNACFGVNTNDVSNPQCTLDNVNAWTYGGRIIVKPNLVGSDIRSNNNVWDYLEDFVGSE